VHAGTDRIRAADILPVDVRAQRQVLSRGVAKRLGERVGHGERDRDGVARLRLDPRDGQAVKFGHQRVLTPWA
jgi:hypothetical protein